jgi:hypothetical protein
LNYGDFRIEVKSSAECQSWHQDRPSKIQFSIRKAVVWNPATGKYEGEPTRCADVYVFCHYPESDKTEADVLDIPAWDFLRRPCRSPEPGVRRSEVGMAIGSEAGDGAMQMGGLKAAVDRALAATAAERRMQATLSGSAV